MDGFFHAQTHVIQDFAKRFATFLAWLNTPSFDGTLLGSYEGNLFALIIHLVLNAAEVSREE